jgi:hypothetical protein
MPNYKKATKEEIDERRAIVADLMLKGLYKPSMILSQKGIKNRYDNYNNPYDQVIRDIKSIQKTFQLYSKDRPISEVVGELILKLELQKRNLWNIITNGTVNEKLAILKMIQELDEKIAFYQGVDPNTAVAKTTDINISSNITPVFDHEIQKKILKDEGIE